MNQPHPFSLWLILTGLSLLFVGGFVLWVYGARESFGTPHAVEGEAARKLHKNFVHWFLLYGVSALFAGIGCLLTAVMMIL